MLVFKNRSKREGFSNHLVIICDEAGIFDAFNLIKIQLTDRHNAFLSLIYTVSGQNSHPRFGRELNILEKIFPKKLNVYLIKIDTEEFGFQQEFIEAIINSNLIPKISFSVFGKAEYTNQVNEVLHFLNINTSFIEIKIVKHL